MKLFALILLLLTGAFGTLAQTVDFNNTRTFTTSADRTVYHNRITRLVGTDYVAQLYYGANAGSLNPVTSNPVRFRNIPNTDPLAGTWAGATRTLTGFNAGDVVTLQVWAWNAAGGATWATSTERGQSFTFTYRIPAAGSLPTEYYIEGLRSFYIGIPEPTSIGLLALAGSVLWLARKRKVGR